MFIVHIIFALCAVMALTLLIVFPFLRWLDNKSAQLDHPVLTEDGRPDNMWD